MRGDIPLTSVTLLHHCLQIVSPFIKSVSVKRRTRDYCKPSHWVAVTVTVVGVRVFRSSHHVTLRLPTGEQWIDHNRPKKKSLEHESQLGLSKLWHTS